MEKLIENPKPVENSKLKILENNITSTSYKISVLSSIIKTKKIFKENDFNNVKLLNLDFN